MIEPEVTAVLGRRLLAFLLDSSLVVATGLGVAFQSSTAFAVVGRDPDDNALVDPAEFEAMKELLDFEIFGQSEILGVPVVRAQEVGDSMRIFGQDAYIAGLGAAALAALVLFGLVPMVLQRTLGMLPFGIGIRTTDGTRAGIGAHLVRTIVGFIDAIPFVVPGAVGFLAAGTSSHRQRLGDRSAKTVVVNVKALRRGASDDQPVDLDLRSTDHIVADNTPTSAVAVPESVQPEAAIPATSDPVDATSTEPGQQESPASAPVAARAEEAASAAATAATADASKPPIAKPTFGDPLPPPPVHRKPPSEHPLGTPSHAAEAAPSSVDDSTSLQDTAAAPTFEAASEVEAPTTEYLSSQTALPLDLGAAEEPAADDLAVADRAWQPPREEPAPVWQPSVLETAPIESPDPHDGRTLDDVERIDPSIAALLSDTPASDEPAKEETTSSRPGNHSVKESSAKTPVWSDKWRAWMYWDTTKKCWLRHDAASNTWQPVD